MVYSLSYRRPPHVSLTSTPDNSLSNTEKQKSSNDSMHPGRGGMFHGIPDALSFDRIIAGGVCPPCTVRDFMNYLKYIELSAENLQFFLWLQDYTKRFNSLPDSEKVLSPEWTVQDVEPKKQAQPKKISSVAKEVYIGTDFGDKPRIVEVEKSNPFLDAPRSPYGNAKLSFDSGCTSSTGGRVNHTLRATNAFKSVGLQWKPLSVQPYREEITRIISIYIADGGTRQLNLSSKERSAMLHALQNTTHPSAFRDVKTNVEWSLRCQAHLNFIRWTICNGNRPRVVFARCLGIASIVLGIATAVLLTLSSARRSWRIISAIAFFIGISTLIAAWKGMCVVLHGMHHRHLRPWELFTSDDESAGYDPKGDSYDNLSSQESRNSFEDEPWVAKYEKRNIVRKIFDREIWIKEPALRQIQDTIFLQSIIGAIVFTAIAAGIFCVLPQGNLY